MNGVFMLRHTLLPDNRGHQPLHPIFLAPDSVLAFMTWDYSGDESGKDKEGGEEEKGVSTSARGWLTGAEEAQTLWKWGRCQSRCWRLESPGNQTYTPTPLHFPDLIDVLVNEAFPTLP